MGSKVSQSRQKTKGVSECKKKIRKIKTMRREIALAHGVFQQPVNAQAATVNFYNPTEEW
jgi:hypothetical protein